jgi:gluconolactonase
MLIARDKRGVGGIWLTVCLSIFCYTSASAVDVQETVVPADPDLVLVASGFRFPEGPAYDGQGNIYCSNCAADYVTRISADGQVEIAYRANHNGDKPFTFLKTNGMTFFRDGSLFACDFERNAIIRIYPDGHQELVVDRCDGQPFRGPNDLAFDPKGYLYFTDPTGSDASHRIGAIYRVDIVAHKAIKVADSLAFPNGIAFSGDGKWLYVCEDNLNRIIRFRVRKDGHLSLPEVFATLDADGPGHPDGMAIDKQGHLWIAHYGQHRVLELDGKGQIVRKVQLPVSHGEGDEGPTNLEFAGRDMRTLYITDPGTDSLYKIRVKVAGLTLFCAPPNRAKGG